MNAEVMERVIERVAPTPSPYAQDPAGWIEGVLGERPWSKQREIGESLVANRYTAVRSCHSSGKSYLASRLAAWWISEHPVGEAFVVSTAPTAPQVETILWREIARAHRKGGLEGRILSGAVPMWKMGSEIVAYGRKPADYADAEQAASTFQGIHAKYVLVILDEAGGIPIWLWNAVDTLASNEHARVLAIGNPDDPATHFSTISLPGSGWNGISVSAFDTPAYTGEEVGDDLLDLLISPTWVEERKYRWGEGSPLYISKVLGEFPEVGEDTLISPGLIRAAIERELPGIEPGRYGADIARKGSDKSIVYRNRGGVLRRAGSWTGKTTMETVGKLGKILDAHRDGIPMVVDVIGIGAGVFDRLRELDYPVNPFNASQRAVEFLKFKNRRAEAWWMTRELFEQGNIDIEASDLDLQAQLTAVKWWIDSSGRTVIESKDDMIKRLGVSPDHADAAIMSLLDYSDWGEYLPDSDDEPVADLTSDLLERAM